MADFVVEFSMTSNPDTIAVPNPVLESPEWPANCKAWILYIDGASNQAGCGVRIKCSHCFRFEFKATNNEAEYEALLAGMEVDEELGADFLLVRSDLQLVVNHVSGLYQAKGDNMVAYLKRVQEAMTIFKGMKME